MYVDILYASTLLFSNKKICGGMAATIYGCPCAGASYSSVSWNSERSNNHAPLHTVETQARVLPASGKSHSHISAADFLRRRFENLVGLCDLDLWLSARNGQVTCEGEYLHQIWNLVDLPLSTYRRGRDGHTDGQTKYHCVIRPSMGGPFLMSGYIVLINTFIMRSNKLVSCKCIYKLSRHVDKGIGSVQYFG